MWDALGWVAYQALHVADEHVIEKGARLIAVADVVKSFGAILAGEIEENFLATAVDFVSLVVLGFNLGWVKLCKREDNGQRRPFFLGFCFRSPLFSSRLFFGFRYWDSRVGGSG